jgi:hypothetical protein
MSFTTLGKNALLASHGIDRVGVFTGTSKVLTTPFGVNSTDIFTSTGHGMANGTPVIITAKTGGSALVQSTVNGATRVYYVIATATNTFQLALTPGGTAVDLGSDLTAGTVMALAEPGAPYARVTIAFSAAANGVADDSTNGAVLSVPASVNVDCEGGWNNTSGELRMLNWVTQAVGDASNWTYTITDLKLGLGD